MLSDSLIYVPVWLALVAWFVGSLARATGARYGDDPAEIVYRFAWLFGATMIVLHIVTSYAVVHGWSHAVADQATAEESERVTAIRAGWGVYVNFAFAAAWLGYSIAMVLGRRRWPGVDHAVFWFTAAIVFSATVVFEAGTIRWLSVAGFLLLAVSWFWMRRSVSTVQSKIRNPR